MLFDEGYSILVEVKDEKGNVFVIQSIAIVDHKNMEYYKKYALLLLIGEIENIGKNLTIVA